MFTLPTRSVGQLRQWAAGRQTCQPPVSWTLRWWNTSPSGGRHLSLETVYFGHRGNLSRDSPFFNRFWQSWKCDVDISQPPHLHPQDWIPPYDSSTYACVPEQGPVRLQAVESTKLKAKGATVLERDNPSRPMGPQAPKVGRFSRPRILIMWWTERP